MIGLFRKAIEPLEPEGQVKVSGEIWKAKSVGGKIGQGDAVRVVDMEGLKLLVSRAKESNPERLANKKREDQV
jgi:membrane-bound ClpP family serine protease